MIGQFRNRIKINRYGQPTQTAGGGLVTPVHTVTTKWAKVENRSGMVMANDAQREWNYDYKITVRYTPSFVEKSSDEIEHNERKMLVRSVSFEDEGKERFVILRCSLNE